MNQTPPQDSGQPQAAAGETQAVDGGVSPANPSEAQRVDEPASAASATEAPSGAKPAPESAALHGLVVELEARVAEANESNLRARAELENLRKRAQLDVAAAHKFAIESFAESLLPVRDSLEMALKTETPSIENLLEGVTATLRLMASAFEKHKLLEIDPVGERFDPNRHQAISMIPTADVPANHVASVLQKGYMINDRVLRPALVTVRGG